MELTVLLKQFGLHEKEAQVYLAALALGQGSMSELARKAGLKRPTTYLMVEQLQVAGLLSQTRVGKHLTYAPAHPHRLLELARARLYHTEKTLPELVALYNLPPRKPKIQVYEGLAGVKSLYRELYAALSRRQEALWFSNIGALREYVPEALSEYKKILRELENPRIRELNFGDEEGKRWSQELKRLRGRHHFIRLLPTQFPFGHNDNLIFGNKLVIFSLGKEVFVVIIEDQEIVATYRALFEQAWLQGKES